MIDIKVHDLDKIEPDLFPAAPGRAMFGVIEIRDAGASISTFYYNTSDIRRHIAALEALAYEMDEHQKTEGVE